MDPKFAFFMLLLIMSPFAYRELNKRRQRNRLFNAYKEASKHPDKDGNPSYGVYMNALGFKVKPQDETEPDA